MGFSAKDLVDFEKEVIREWKKGETYGPVHLSGGNEEQLIKIFKKIKPQDWVFSTHRSHYHALLKSKDKKWLMDEILVKANSSHINSNKHKIFTSAIVGGCLPIALGVAMGIKRRNDELKKYLQNMKGKDWKVEKDSVKVKCKEHVWVFVGDMASEMGCFDEAVKYAEGENLPITFIIEDNDLACETPTYKVWKCSNPSYRNVIKYDYVRHYPHCGCNFWLKFKKRKFTSTGNYDAYK